MEREKEGVRASTLPGARRWTPTAAGVTVYMAMLGACFLQHGAVAPEALDRHIPDDSYYFLQIARQLADGHGSCFSPGEPTNGYHPLWLWVLTALRVALPVSRDGMVLLVAALGALLTAASAVPLQTFLARAGARGDQVRCCALVYVLNPSMALLAINCMETGIYLLLLFAFLASAAASHPMSQRRAPWFGVLAGLLMLARTDAIFFTIPVFAYLALSRRRTLRWLVVAGMVAMLVLAPWLVWNLVTFGTIEQSSSNAMGFTRHLMMGPSFTAWWQASLETIARMLYTLFVFPLVRYSEFGPPSLYVGGAALVLVATVVFVHRVLDPQRHVTVPAWYWGPVVALFAYYSCVRHFLQAWHLSTLAALAAIVAGGLVANLGATGRRITWIVLAVASLLATRNGYFAPGDGGIADVRAWAATPHGHLTIGNTDAGRFAYFCNDEVVNLDGVVNNRVMRYIRAGRVADYLFLRRFDIVMMTEDRHALYDRNIGTEPVADAPPAPDGEGDARQAVQGCVDVVRAVRNDGDTPVVRIEGWVGAGDCDAAAALPLLAFLDARQQPLATFRGKRVARFDVMKALCDGHLRFSGCVFELPRDRIPVDAQFVRLGSKRRDGTLWIGAAVPFTRP